MTISFKIITIFTFIALFSACASVNKMPLGNDTKTIDTSEKSVLLGRITIQNQNKANHQPKLHFISIKKDEKYQSFTGPVLISEVKNKSKDYIFSLVAEPGTAELRFMSFIRQAFLINGTASLPIEQEIEFPENGIVYLGNIKATIVPRKEGQPRAGSVIPLIDQSVTGFSTGTFVVDISDNYESDIQLLKKKFPYLADEKIEKAVLSKWEYPKKN